MYQFSFCRQTKAQVKELSLSKCITADKPYGFKNNNNQSEEYKMEILC